MLEAAPSMDRSMVNVGVLKAARLMYNVGMLETTLRKFDELVMLASLVDHT